MIECPNQEVCAEAAATLEPVVVTGVIGAVAIVTAAHMWKVIK